MEAIKKQWQTKVTVGLFIFFTLWWSYLRLNFGKESLHNQLFAACYGLIALWGGIWGLRIAQKWGGLKSVLGRSISMFSLGLFAQEFGQLVYSYYIYFLKIEVPYPSWGDLGYFSSVLFYIGGILLLAKASGVEISLKSFESRLQAIIIPLAILVLSYFIFLQGYIFDWSKPLTIFLDFGYPLGEAIYISLALITYFLSRKLLGGIMKDKILFILLALLVQYSSDFTFLYQASKETWYAGGFNDYMYLVAYFIMTLGLLQLNTVLIKLRTYTNPKN